MMMSTSIGCLDNDEADAGEFEEMFNVAETGEPEDTIVQFVPNDGAESGEVVPVGEDTDAWEDDSSWDAEGERDGADYEYWQRRNSCRKLTLPQPDGSVVTIYDENDNNTIGDHGWDYYRIDKGDEYIEYSKSGVEKSDGWSGEELENEKALADATAHFKPWRAWIIGKHRTSTAT